MFWRNEDDPGVVAQRRPTVDVVVPVFNEERALPGCVEVLSRYLAERIRSGCREDTTAEKVQIGAAEHLALEHLEPVDVTLQQS